MVGALARAGHHVIYCNSRYRTGDMAVIMEKVVLDLAACVRHAKEQLGYEKVVLAGWSGGGSLSLFYQAEAEDPSVTATPAGEPPDLTAAGLIPADGIMLLAAHVSRAHTLTEWLDASILDETDPTKRDHELDVFDPSNPNQPPYSDDFILRYREAQVARNRRITAWVREKLAELNPPGAAKPVELGFVVHGTMADPRLFDGELEPSEREIGWSYLGDPEVVNDGPVGLARFCSLRSWLSQWSYDDSNADGVACAARVSVPGLVIGNMADVACTPSHHRRLFDALGSQDKQQHEIPGATHYYIGQRDELAESVSICSAWLHERDLG
jgi:pimeloyl-ACP methyl ester carboxylesterase